MGASELLTAQPSVRPLWVLLGQNQAGLFLISERRMVPSLFSIKGKTPTSRIECVSPCSLSSQPSHRAESLAPQPLAGEEVPGPRGSSSGGRQRSSPGLLVGTLLGTGHPGIQAQPQQSGGFGGGRALSRPSSSKSHTSCLISDSPLPSPGT